MAAKLLGMKSFAMSFPSSSPALASSSSAAGLGLVMREVWRLGLPGCYPAAAASVAVSTCSRMALLARVSQSQGVRLVGSIRCINEGISEGLLQFAGFRCDGRSVRLHTVTHSHSTQKKSLRKSRSQGLRCSSEAEVKSEETDNTLLKWEKGGGLVHSLANVHTSVVVEPGALVNAHAHIGANSRISAGCVVGPSVVVGNSSTLGFNVVLQNCSVGDSCILHPGVCIGQDGFGFLENNAGEIVKKPQLLRVQIGSHVEIGANTCIDRGSWRDTVIGDYTKIDNLVQIGHNAIVGRGCMICGQVGIAGSTNIGDYVVVGGKAGVSDHVTVTSRVRIAAKSGVITNIESPGDYAGFPAVPAREWRKQMVVLRKIGRSASKEANIEDAAREE